MEGDVAHPLHATLEGESPAEARREKDALVQAMVETPENLPAGDLGFDGWYKRPLIIFGHVVLATVGAGLVASLMWKRLFALALAVNVLGARDLLGLFSTPFFPVQFAIGAALGYLFSRIFP